MPLQEQPQIAFHQIDHSDAVEADIRGKIAELEALHDAVISCRVVVERDHVLRDGEGPVSARFELSLPGGKTIVGGGKGTRNDAFPDADAAVKAAFDAAKRQLHDYVDKRRSFTKTHEVPPHGVVARIDPAGDFGFLTTSDGLDVYFHRNAVVDGVFEDLSPGDEIRFILHAEEGIEGPQAASVQPLGKRDLPNVEAVRS
jgi:cold shock CspA family protein